MRARCPVLLVAAFAALMLAGCLGTTGPAAPSGQTGEQVPAAPATQATLHRPDASTALGQVQATLNGTPVPVAQARYTGSWGFEPTLGVDTQGNIFMSSLLATPPTTGDEVTLMRSQDDGVTWTDVTPKVGPKAIPPQSFDPYVHVDPETDRVFVSDLGPLNCATLSFSDDQGETWITNPLGCGHPLTLHDHQTIWTSPYRTVEPVGYPNVLHYCVNRLVDTACATSLNGGLSFGPLVPRVFGGCGGTTAHGVAGPDGTVYIGKADACGAPTVAISADDGLTWETSVVTEDVAAKDHELALAVDEARNVYAFWIGEDRKPYLAVSTDGGGSWGEPRMVAPPGVETTDFPTIAAGADGRIALAYTGTTSDGDPSEMGADDTWNAYLATILEADSADPVIATATVHPPSDPIGRGNCTFSTRCYAESGGALGDFIDVVIDQEGRPWAAFVDACTEECAGPDGEQNDVGKGFVGTLVDGPALRGELRPLAALQPLEG